MSSVPRAESSNIQRQLIPMGAYIIVLPDKVYFNTVDSNDCGTIEYSVSSTVDETVTIRPCNSDGSIYKINGVKSKMPTDYFDEYIWLDTSTTPAKLKKFYTSNSMWSTVPNYVRITSVGIGEKIKEGDGVKITGLENIYTQTLNGTTIIKKVIDKDNIVIGGLLDSVENRNIMKVKHDVKSDKSTTNVSVYCNSIAENEFANKKLNINGNLYECIGNTQPQTSIEYEIDTSDLSKWLGSDTPDLEVYCDCVNSNKIYINLDYSNGMMTDALTVNTPIITGDKERILRCMGTGYEENTVLTTGVETPVIRYYLKVDEDVTISKGTKLFPIKTYVSDNLYSASLTLNTEGSEFSVNRNDEICLALESAFEQNNPVTINRKMPIMDYVIENKNRLWGCRYGEDEDGNFVNEIYASKLGDFKNWNCFEGVSTDSYRASLGSTGKFTGAVSYLGYPLFFKEEYLHTVYGNYPAQYQINDNACRGVEEGSEDSIAIINETLFYKAKTGIMAYSGALPTEISYSFGNKIYKNAKACAFINKYYVEMFDVDTNENVLMIFDTKHKLWYKENPINAFQICATDEDVYYLNNKYDFCSLFGSGEATEDDVEWSLETGDIGLSYVDKKYVTRMSIRMSMELGANVSVFIQYDSNGEWIHKMSFIGKKLKTVTLPIRPQRCDHFKIKIKGKGNVKIYSISKTLEQGSDI